MKILNQDRTKALYYYELFKAVKRGKKKYINRKFLMSLCKMEESHAGFKLFKRGRGICSTLSISEFRKSLIQLIWIFLDS